MMPSYLQPIAQHPANPERLLLRDEDDRAYVWLGNDPGGSPEEIDPRTAAWFLNHRWLRPLPCPRYWLHAADLPVANVGTRESTAEPLEQPRP